MRRYLLLILVALIVGCTSSQKTVTLTYNPPADLEFSGKVLTSRVQSAMGQTVTDSTISFTSHRLETVPEGWRVVTVTDSVLKGQAGPHATDAMNTLLLGNEFVQVIGKDGRAVSLEGYEPLFKRIDSAFGEEQARVFRATMGPDLLTKRELREWNTTVGRFAALSPMAINEWVFDTTSVELPSGARLTYYQATRLTETLQDAGKECAKIEIAAHTDVAELAKMAEVPEADLQAKFEGMGTDVANDPNQEIVALQHSTWTVETATLLLHHKEMLQEIDVTLPSRQGQKVNTHVVEREIKNFTY